MNKLYPLFYLFILSISISCSTDQDNQVLITGTNFDAEKYIEQLRLSDCPDKRVCIFDIKKDTDGKWSGVLSESKTMKALNETLSKNGISHSVKLLPEKDLETEFGLISVSTAQLRGEAKHSSELVSQGLLGQPLRILKEQDDWYYVQLVDGYLGWMESLSFIPVSRTTLDDWTSSERVFVLNKNIDVLNEDGNIITELVAANIVSLTEDSSDDLTKIKLPNGQSGIVNNLEYLKVSEWRTMDVDLEAMLDLANEYMGIPYVWGGATTKGFDCSGFTKTVFLLNGIHLPRDASQQVRCGELINTSENFNDLEKGDLLFFGKKVQADQREKITHVAIYLGNLDFIHASGEVRIQSLDPSSSRFAQNRLETFIRAKRITSDCIGNYQHQL